MTELDGSFSEADLAARGELSTLRDLLRRERARALEHVPEPIRVRVGLRGDHLASVDEDRSRGLRVCVDDDELSTELGLAEEREHLRDRAGNDFAAERRRDRDVALCHLRFMGRFRARRVAHDQLSSFG
jgi:hypothetical protein